MPRADPAAARRRPKTHPHRRVLPVEAHDGVGVGHARDVAAAARGHFAKDDVVGAEETGQCQRPHGRRVARHGDVADGARGDVDGSLDGEVAAVGGRGGRAEDGEASGADE